MPKTKKNVLKIFLIAAAVLTILDTIVLFFFYAYTNIKFADPYATYPVLIPPDTYVRIEDVEYIRYDGVFLDPEKSVRGVEGYQESDLEAQRAQ